MNTIEIIADDMAIMDQDGNVIDCCKLVGLRQAKRQLRRWLEEYPFNYAEAMNALSAYFSHK